VETHHPDPPPPDWPVNNKAVPASVAWDGRDLSISAANSSLDQILKDVSTATGLKVEGVKDDQRIFGSFGPAPARDVLSNLLEGSGYNILMIGDQGEGTPRELVLTAKTHVVANQPGANRNQTSDDEAVEEPEPVDQPEPAMRRPGVVPPPGQGRTPEQFLQEMQQRRQQLQDQQQQQPQQGAPVQPPSTVPPQ
jgi:hypothetical protein